MGIVHHQVWLLGLYWASLLKEGVFALLNHCIGCRWLQLAFSRVFSAQVTRWRPQLPAANPGRPIANYIIEWTVAIVWNRPGQKEWSRAFSDQKWRSLLIRLQMLWYQDVRRALEWGSRAQTTWIICIIPHFEASMAGNGFACWRLWHALCGCSGWSGIKRIKNA